MEKAAFNPKNQPNQGDGPLTKDDVCIGHMYWTDMGYHVTVLNIHDHYVNLSCGTMGVGCAKYPIEKLRRTQPLKIELDAYPGEDEIWVNMENVYSNQDGRPVTITCVNNYARTVDLQDDSGYSKHDVDITSL